MLLYNLSRNVNYNFIIYIFVLIYEYKKFI
jgi:hypothetical protein